MGWEPISEAEFFPLLADNEEHEFAIVLSGGVLSIKTIKKNKNGRYSIFNSIDSSTQYLTRTDLFRKPITNIGYALRRGSLVVHKE